MGRPDLERGADDQGCWERERERGAGSGSGSGSGKRIFSKISGSGSVSGAFFI
jgi:hypothetical protein